MPDLSGPDRLFGSTDKRLRFGLLGLFIAAIFLGSSGPVHGQFGLEVLWPPELQVVPPEYGFPAGETVSLGLAMSPDFGLHIYRDRIRVELETQTGVAFLETKVPPGVEIPDMLEPGNQVTVLEDDFQVEVVFKVTAPAGSPVEIQGAFHLQGCTDELCYPPEQIDFQWKGTAVGASASETGQQNPASDDRSPMAFDAETGGASVNREASGAGGATSAGDLSGVGGTPGAEEDPAGWGQILSMIFGAFGAGILLSLTPCVLPMIPITSAIILRFSRGGLGSALYSSSIYVLGLALTYAAAGVAVAFVGGAVRSIFNTPWFLSAIAAIFVLLSLSMFGLFDIALPSGLAGKLQQRQAASNKNRLGLLVMGMISGLIVGPCVTAPIAGLLLLIAQVGSPMVGFWTMFALAWGMGLLIIAAGTFTGLVPKAGEWTDWFKKFFGFVMLWGALYFIRSLIGPAAFELGTAVLLVVAAVFLGGFDHLPVEAGWAQRLRKLVGVFCITFALFVGLDLFFTLRNPTIAPTIAEAPETAAFKKGGSAELDTAFRKHQPAVLYFTAGWCDICKSLKSKTLTRPEVAEALKGIAAIQVDFDEHRDLVDRYKVSGPPTLVFLDRQGEERRDLRVSGFQTVQELIERIEQLGSKR